MQLGTDAKILLPNKLHYAMITMHSEIKLAFKNESWVQTFKIPVANCLDILPCHFEIEKSYLKNCPTKIWMCKLYLMQQLSCQINLC